MPMPSSRQTGTRSTSASLPGTAVSSTQPAAAAEQRQHSGQQQRQQHAVGGGSGSSRRTRFAASLLHAFMPCPVLPQNNQHVTNNTAHLALGLTRIPQRPASTACHGPKHVFSVGTTHTCPPPPADLLHLHPLPPSHTHARRRQTHLLLHWHHTVWWHLLPLQADLLPLSTPRPHHHHTHSSGSGLPSSTLSVYTHGHAKHTCSPCTPSPHTHARAKHTCSRGSTPAALLSGGTPRALRGCPQAPPLRFQHT